MLHPLLSPGEGGRGDEVVYSGKGGREDEIDKQRPGKAGCEYMYSQ